ncbi:PIR Superfamily Protein [Plasmodium ovale wallikeri]|uniref:PIR Superfamily Protein n=1 Tax=Plasmodium ovale wallikeri TaxID=864142 RepID=A0A1A9ARP1_PLAOA|nr:PIR Superfamily Protein [Plasmodium ovale wallikeri]SBT58835.1 PIR Superfamily Protein [Plasmodium ovale wallikeri]
MTNTFNVEDLPSKTHYKELQEIIKYDDIIEYVTNEMKDNAIKWLQNFDTYAKNYLSKYPFESTKDNPNKRCRDLVHTLKDIKKKINELEDSTDYKEIEENINTFTDSFSIRNYDDCSMVLNNEDILMENKNIDDACEDIIFVKDNICRINDSIQCEEIKSYFEKIDKIISAVYTVPSGEYYEILKLYDFHTYDSFKSILQQITCSPCESSFYSRGLQGGNTPSPSSLTKISVSIVLLIFGISLICFLLYTRSPLGRWFDTRVLKKEKGRNNFIDEITSELEEDSSEWSYTNSSNIGYNMN